MSSENKSFEQMLEMAKTVEGAQQVEDILAARGADCVCGKEPFCRSCGDKVARAYAEAKANRNSMSREADAFLWSLEVFAMAKKGGIAQELRYLRSMFWAAMAFRMARRAEESLAEFHRVEGEG